MSLKDEQPVGALEAPGQRISEPCLEWPVVSEGTWVILSLTNGVRGMDCGMLPSRGTFGSWQHLGVVEQARPGLLGTWPLWRAKCLLWGRRWALMAGDAAGAEETWVSRRGPSIPLAWGGITGRSGGSGIFRFLCSHPKTVHSPSNTNFHLPSICPT